VTVIKAPDFILFASAIPLQERTQKSFACRRRIMLLLIRMAIAC
jgi:hypothetical protein